MSAEPAGSFSVTVPAHGDETLLDATLSSLVTGDESPPRCSWSSIPTIPGRARWPNAPPRATLSSSRSSRIGRIPALVFGDRSRPARRDRAGRDRVGVPDGRGQPYEVVIVVEADDPVTREVAERVATATGRIVNVVVQAALEDAVTGEPTGARTWPPCACRRLPVTPPMPPPVAAKQVAGHVAARCPTAALGRARLVGVAAAAAAVAAAINTGSPLYLLYVGVSFLLAAIAWTTLVWMVNAWRTPAALVESGLSGTALAPAALVFVDSPGPPRGGRP